MKNPLLTTGLLMLLSGLFVMIPGAIFVTELQRRAEIKACGVSVEGRISNITKYFDTESRCTHYDVLVSFKTRGGKEISGYIDHIIGMRTGDSINIIYREDDPNDFINSSSRGIISASICLIIFAAVAVIGAVNIVKHIIRKFLFRMLRNEGERVVAELIGLKEDQNTEINGRHPIRLEAYSNGVVYLSDYLSYKEAQKYACGVYGTVDVYIDRYDNSIGFADKDSVRLAD